mgnify:CR=1 FL=1
MLEKLKGLALRYEDLETRLGDPKVYGDTEKLFSQPRDKRTEDYITGRFG